MRQVGVVVRVRVRISEGMGLGYRVRPSWVHFLSSHCSWNKNYWKRHELQGLGSAHHRTLAPPMHPHLYQKARCLARIYRPRLFLQTLPCECYQSLQRHDRISPVDIDPWVWDCARIYCVYHKCRCRSSSVHLLSKK